jgi:hypothetical protein
MNVSLLPWAFVIAACLAQDGPDVRFEDIFTIAAFARLTAQISL